MPVAAAVVWVLLFDESDVRDEDGVRQRCRAAASSYDFWAGDRMKYDDCGLDWSRGWLSYGDLSWKL